MYHSITEVGYKLIVSYVKAIISCRPWCELTQRGSLLIELPIAGIIYTTVTLCRDVTWLE
jgi:hypothetical protein